MMTRLSLAVVVLLAALGAASPAPAASLLEPLVDYGDATGTPRFSLLDVPVRTFATDTLSSPLFGGPWLSGLLDVTPLRLADPGTTISFDLRLGWPSGNDRGPASALQPYLTFGPALFLTEPADTGSPLPVRGDGSAILGVKAGAGVTWRIERETALYGEYRVTRGGVDALAPLGIRGGGTDVGGFDLLYGLRVRF